MIRELLIRHASDIAITALLVVVTVASAGVIGLLR